MKTLLCILTLSIFLQLQAQGQEPLKLAVAGLDHGHVGWVFNSMNRGDYEIVGIAEPNRELAEKYAKQHGLSMELFFEDLEKLLDEKKPEAVAAFGNTFQHLAVVEAAAPRGVHVMVEKPLAVSLEHAQKMKALAEKHNIHLLTNYETSWYPTNHRAKELLDSGKVGNLQKVVVRDGHRGPKKIGVGPEFLSWLIDPKLNGGGALMDFGCYGANLMTWLMDGERPISVTAVTQQLQPENNPQVEDDATIIVNYPNAQVIIQASWNWPIGRKDMEVYGLTGTIFADNRNQLRVRMAEGYDGFDEQTYLLPEMEPPYPDPFMLLKAVVRNEIKLPEYDLYSLENNMTVMEILQAAKESAEKGETIYF
ncbi:Gfo/Idh/MocA family protein [Algoriphagus zhangzhouensis]|uniref:Predicted dehydrogenase n=1 Tax=Algoriphagus zhangzhouensis TaxID=1073327 RepID=A0A1M7ZJ67_9BACT|nr:Gfo/Idh/MocA family oxidoreductase [Algoriphagus zhangzhouensis]TDY43610.1 putative dehydrogenase [Algoriphagus zhangzhouensis]SHO64933.1 Predicted dehydrogenase [Algoriphagus zhangzhouensis]